MVKLRGGIVWSGANKISRSGCTWLHLRDRYFQFMRYWEGGWEVVLIVYQVCCCFFWFSLLTRIFDVLDPCRVNLEIILWSVALWLKNGAQGRRSWMLTMTHGSYG